MSSVLFFMSLLQVIAQAQKADTNLMYSNGRIYVVIAVLLIILLGLVLYLVRIEKKLKKLEKQQD
ncbi:hypothetical protein GCM10027051_27140 [Niabella terrae]